MKRKIFAMGLAAVMVISLLSGCSGKGQNNTSGGSSIEVPSNNKPSSGYTGGPSGGKPAQKPVINFEGVVTAVDDDTITLSDGKTVIITDDTIFASDPDSDAAVSKDVAVGNYIQGYTADNVDANEVTASNIWTNDAPTTRGKLAVNFEGRVASVEDGKVTLEDGTVVLTGGAEISSPDGSAAEIAVGDYIQGYAEDPDAAELHAESILITAL